VVVQRLGLSGAVCNQGRRINGSMRHAFSDDRAPGATVMESSAGWGELFSRAEQLEQQVQMLMRVFSSTGVLPLEFKPERSVGDLLT
jgi:hypothetical protein